MKQKEALDILKLGHNVYLTGCAGSGKTYTLNKYISYLKDNKVKVAITASTGIAATHLGGITIHSCSGMGIKDDLLDEDINAILKKKYLVNKFKKMKVLIIDEISMLHAHQLDMVDKICKAFKRNHLPFGGIQIIVCGDFFQLPPVSRNGKQVVFAYNSKAWIEADFKVCYLEEQFRQTDHNLNRILNDIRSNDVTEETVEILMKRHNQKVETKEKITKLYTHNINVDLINDAELNKIPGAERGYLMEETGIEALVNTLKSNCLAPQRLILKKGALVMFIKNNFDEGYVNGTLGEIIDFDEDEMPIVQTKSGDKINVKKASWAIEENDRVIAEIKQLPIRLAWAITIHKSQGMSLDSAEINLSKCFEQGMGYVALSRVRSLDGINLTGINNQALRINEEVLELDTLLRKESRQATQELHGLTKKELTEKQNEFISEANSDNREQVFFEY